MKKADLLLAAIALVAYAVSLYFYVGHRVGQVEKAERGVIISCHY